MADPVITTERLALYRPQAADLPAVAAIVASDEVRRFLGNREADMPDEFSRFLRNAGSWALYGYGNFMVRERGSSDLIGICGVFHTWRGFDGFDDVPEAGWILARPVWGHGYATEAMAGALAWFDQVHGARRIACMIDTDNQASHTVAARLGFVAYGEHDFAGHSVVLLQRGG
jgi:RimJ/RimL family protein N-acetyltransferase